MSKISVLGLGHMGSALARAFIGSKRPAVQAAVRPIRVRSGRPPLEIDPRQNNPRASGLRPTFRTTFHSVENNTLQADLQPPERDIPIPTITVSIGMVIDF